MRTLPRQACGTNHDPYWSDRTGTVLYSYRKYLVRYR